MPVKATEIDLLVMQTIEVLADLAVGLLAVNVDRVDNPVCVPITVHHRVVFAGSGATPLRLNLAHSQVCSVHLSSQLLEVLEVLEADLLHSDRVEYLIGSSRGVSL